MQNIKHLLKTTLDLAPSAMELHRAERRAERVASKCRLDSSPPPIQRLEALDLKWDKRFPKDHRDRRMNLWENNSRKPRTPGYHLLEPIDHYDPYPNGINSIHESGYCRNREVERAWLRYTVHDAAEFLVMDDRCPLVVLWPATTTSEVRTVRHNNRAPEPQETCFLPCGEVFNHKVKQKHKEDFYNRRGAASSQRRIEQEHRRAQRRAEAVRQREREVRWREEEAEWRQEKKRLRSYAKRPEE
jgi:hypothetical protein